MSASPSGKSALVPGQSIIPMDQHVGGQRVGKVPISARQPSPPNLVNTYALVPRITTRTITLVPAPLLVNSMVSPVPGVTVTPARPGATHRNAPPGCTAMPSPAARKIGTPSVAGRTKLTLFVLPESALR